MKGTFLAIALHVVLAGIVFATATEPTKPLPPEDTLIAKADYPTQNAQVQIWKDRAEIAINGVPYTLYGDAIEDPVGGVTLIEYPTQNAVTLFAADSADVQIGGTLYKFSPE